MHLGQGVNLLSHVLIPGKTPSTESKTPPDIIKLQYRGRTSTHAFRQPIGIDRKDECDMQCKDEMNPSHGRGEDTLMVNNLIPLSQRLVLSDERRRL